MKISEAVKQLRIAAKLSQQKFAVRLGTAISPVQRWEKDLVRPSVPAMVALHELAVEVGRPDLAAEFAFGGKVGSKHNMFSLIVGGLPSIVDTFIAVEMKLTQCVADPSLTEFQRGNLTAEALQLLREGRKTIDRLMTIARPENLS